MMHTFRCVIIVLLLVPSGYAQQSTVADLASAARGGNKAALQQLTAIAQRADARDFSISIPDLVRTLAQFELGTMYADGEGVPKDLVQAASWYRKAADQGWAPAEFNLGKLYYTGDGVSKDLAQAITWIRKAAADQGPVQGWAPAQAWLGLMYYTGDGVPADSTQAAFWYRRAADQGDTFSQRGLGLMYHQGDGVPKDSAQALSWFKKAADQGDATSQVSLGLIYQEGISLYCSK